MQRLKYILLALIAIGLFMFLRTTDWAQIGKLLGDIGWNALWLLFFTFLSAVFGAFGWQYCLPEHEQRRVSFLDLFFIRHIGETVGLLNPTGIVGGDALKAGMVHEKGVATEAAVTSMFVSRSLTMLSHFAVFFVAAALIDVSFSVRAFGYFVAFFFAFWLLFKLLRPLFRRLKLWIINALQQRNATKALSALSTARQQMRLLSQFDKRAAAIAFFFLAVHWVMGGAEFWVILQLLGQDVNLTEAVVIDSGVGFFKAVGLMVPGQVGIEEYGNKFWMERVGVHDPNVWVAASILRRARQIFWIGFGFAIYVWRYK